MGFQKIQPSLQAAFSILLPTLPPSRIEVTFRQTGPGQRVSASDRISPAYGLASQCAGSRNMWNLTSNKKKSVKAANSLRLSTAYPEERIRAAVSLTTDTHLRVFARISPSQFSHCVKFHSTVYSRKGKGFKESCFAAVLCAQHINLNIKYQFKLLRINLNLKLD